ncbi:hypothetical protein EXIGLDRAFT_784620 [Exidia glandulosa HHB12029]|uniref:CxC1-like cysteine cluster associated with KDZ transposases domain-containing protein n=1 Tax=Exidia glandulosa HHB12029 TaxID=1314781 RepID=A0A166MD09_EXIGL|nr:hypothetical protein EXIGLDRAFT_784620 [Exidia glandulosa HHB12029]
MRSPHSKRLQTPLSFFFLMSAPAPHRILQITAADVRPYYRKRRASRVLTKDYTTASQRPGPRRRGPGKKRAQDVLSVRYLDGAADTPNPPLPGLSTPTAVPPVVVPVNGPWNGDDGWTFPYESDETINPQPFQRAPPSLARMNLYCKWNVALADMKPRYLAAREREHRRAPRAPCTCQKRVHRVVCVYWQSFVIRSFEACEHHTLTSAIIEDGLFPSGPVTPGYAFCTELLDFFIGLMRQAADSAQALAAALHMYHRNRGFTMRGTRGQPIREGYRRTLQHSLQWYDILQAQIERDTEELILAAAPVPLSVHIAQTDLASSPPTTPTRAHAPSPPPTNHSHLHRIPFPTCEDVSDDDADNTPSPPPQREAAGAGLAEIWISVARRLGLAVGGVTAVSSYLIDRCPACFALAATGRPHHECVCGCYRVAR